MSRTFAKGEILTAEDVNEYLVNRDERTILRGSEVFTPWTGSVNSAVARIDRDHVEGLAVVTTLSIVLSDTDGLPDGSHITVIGQLAAALIPTARQAAFVTGVNGYGRATIESSGELIVRNTLNGSFNPSVHIRISATNYPL